MPAQVQDTFGYALHLAQTGGKHLQAKPLRSFGSEATSGIATPKPDMDLVRERLKAALVHAGH